jgi:iron complex outermembrane receptor protein
MRNSLHTRALRALLATGVSLGALAAGPALAQQAPAPAPQDEQASTVDDIIVTARRRSERLQDVPVAVTALTAEALENLQASTLGDLEGAVPNLTLHEGDANNAVVYLRGVGQVDSLAFADPGVGVYVDDVYLGRAQGAFLSVYDVDRVEVLRGPQGTLYGRNTIGGAVKFVSSRLTAEPSGRIEASVGDYNLIEARAAYGRALDDDGVWLARGAVSYAARDGYSENAFDGRSDGDRNQVAGRVSLEYRPNDALSVRLNLDGSSDRPDTSRTPARATPVFGFPATSDDPFRVDADFNDKADVDTRGVSVTVDYALNDMIGLKSVTAYRAMDYASHLDLDATPTAFFGVYVEEEQSQFSQEFQLNYTGERVNAVAGLFYFDETDETYSGLLGPAIGVVTSSLNDQHNRSYALYGQATLEVTDRLNLTAGLRYTYEDKDFSRVQNLFLAAPTTVPGRDETGLLLTDLDTSANWDALSPKIGVDYRLSDDVMAYASISRGFKSGGFDGRSNDIDGARPFDQETLWAYEAGVKSTLLDRRLTLNAAAFWNDYTDLQLSSFTSDGAGGFEALFTNAGAATIRGIEVEAVARPVEGLTLNATVGYLDAQYDEYVGPGGVDISDQRELVNAPKWSARLGVVWEKDLGAAGRLTLGADAAHRSKVYPTVSSSEVLAQDGYTVVDAFVRWTDARDRLFAEVGGRNLTDERFIEHGFDLSASPGYQLAYYGAPSTVRLTVGARF